MTNIKPILVTGSHRSGTTWAGEMISAATNVGYIHEPFNKDMLINHNPSTFEYWFQYICEENHGPYEAAFSDIFSFDYPVIRNLSHVKKPRQLAKVVRDQGYSLLNRVNRRRPLMKDPIALFSAEWLANKFDIDVLVMIRHPAAFCSSLKIKSWSFDFEDFLNQELLMETYLHPFEKEISEFAIEEKSVIEQGILLWNCFHLVISGYQDRHPNWLFRTHEALSQDPIGGFEGIYHELDLEFTENVQKTIWKNSGDHNPIEQTQQSEFRRNSRENIANWKKRLTGAEIEMIRNQTSELSELFYTNDDW